VIVLIDQLLGRTAPKRPVKRLPGSSTDFSGLPWDDAKQAGLLALMKAMDTYDPTKGGIAGFMRWQCLAALQKLKQDCAFVRTSKERVSEAPPIDLVGEQRDLDVLARGHEDGLELPEGFTAADLERWESSGEWPDSLEAAHADVAKQREQAEIESHRRHGEAWLAWRLPKLFELGVPSGRLGVFAAHNAYRLDCRRNAAAEVDRKIFVWAVCRSGQVREVCLRVGYSTMRGLAGIAYAKPLEETRMRMAG
jgi:hypothetical protein